MKLSREIERWSDEAGSDFVLHVTGRHAKNTSKWECFVDVERERIRHVNIFWLKPAVWLCPYEKHLWTGQSEWVVLTCDVEKGRPHQRLAGVFPWWWLAVAYAVWLEYKLRLV